MLPKNKKYKKAIIKSKKSIVVQGFNIQSNGNILKGASVENNIAEGGTAEEELIIQGFNLSENSNNNNLEGAFTKNNKVVNYESELGSDEISELVKRAAQSKKDEGEELKELKKSFESFEKQLLRLGNLKKMVKTEKVIDQVPVPDHPVAQVQLTLEKLIGKGGYGGVYRGKWKGQDVAFKKLYLAPNNMSQNDIKEIMNEVNILKNLNNEYIIQYHGTYFDNQQFLIIMDYAENDTLTKFIKNIKNHDWDLNRKFISQMAQGLNYIHYENIIHRDLKSINILLTKNYEVKISDFGLAKTKNIISHSHRSEAVGSLGWMAPEILSDNPKYSEQSDIYALGMIIWEITAKCTTPFKDIDNILVHVVFNNGREKIPNDTPENIRYIIEQCWKKDPKERMTLTKLLAIIAPQTASAGGSSDPKIQKKSNQDNSERFFIINYEPEEKLQPQVEISPKGQ